MSFISAQNSDIPTENLQSQDTIAINSDEFITVNDSITNDSIAKPKPKSAIEYTIIHSAKDYMRENFDGSISTLHNDASIEYGTTKITAGHIVINHETNIVTASGIKDSLGNYKQRPIIIQDGQTSLHDSLKMNYKTERVLAYGTDAEVGGLYTNTDKMKKVNDSTIYVRDIIITTSDKPIPDYHILVKKGKMVPEEKIIAGASQFYIAEVPTPLVLPFAYFPLTKGRRSGLIVPTWGNSNTQGFFLQNGGYYIAASDYFDVTILGDIYTNSSWGLNIQSNYAVKYKFRGAFSFRYENLFQSIRGLSDFSQASNYNIRWNHGQDGKANPNARFSAQVNFGSSKYYRQSFNEFNSNAFLNNSLNSSISFQKTFVGTPFNLTSSVTHTQNTNTEEITMSLPSLQLSMNRIYPFEPKNGPKKNALHNIGVNYNMKGDYRIKTNDDEFLKNEMFKSGEAGIQHDVNANTNMKVLKYFTLSPNVKYKDVWYFDRVKKTYESANDSIITDTIKGFNSFREYSGGAGLSTTLYGDLSFKKGKVQAIRHTVRPSVSYTYRPDFSFYNEEVQSGVDPIEFEEYSPYQNGIYGRPSNGLSSSIGFAVNNVLEAKVKSKDSIEESKKISLLNNLNLSTSYNMAADSLNWSPVSLNAGTSFFNSKMSVNARATLDPYALDVNGRKINTFNINNGGSLFRLTNAGMNMSYSLSNDTFKKEKIGEEEDPNAFDPTNSNGIFGEDMNAANADTFDRTRDDEDSKEKTSDAYGAVIPWTLRIAYTMNYNNTSRQDEISSHSLMFSGNVKLTPKWDVGVSSGYDLKENGITYTQLRFNRDLDSWKMNFNWVPFGPRATYNFYIGIKSSILSDIKYDQRRVPDKALF